MPELSQELLGALSQLLLQVVTAAGGRLSLALEESGLANSEQHSCSATDPKQQLAYRGEIGGMGSN